MTKKIDFLKNIFKELAVLHHKKSIIYKDSWKKHGELMSIFCNITRKYDRITSIAENDFRINTKDETIYDTLGDISVYCIKYITYIADTYEDSFLTFLSSFNKNNETIGNYKDSDKGFSLVIELLLSRFQIEKFEEMWLDINSCLNVINNSYSQLEMILLNNNDKNNNNKSFLSADLALASAYAICILSNFENNNLADFIRTINNQ